MTDADVTRADMHPSVRAHKAYRVAQSNIPNAGRGAFAVRDLKKGSEIGSYVIATKRQNKAEFLESHPSGRATHTAIVKGDYYTATGAGNRTQNAIGMLNNAGRGGRNNAKLLASGRVVTSRNVKKGRRTLTLIRELLQNLKLQHTQAEKCTSFSLIQQHTSA